MAHKDVVKFIEKAVRDAALQAKLKDIKATNDEEVMEQIIRIASDSGYSFKKSEFEDLCLAQAASEVKNESGEELSQEKLESIASDAGIFCVRACRSSVLVSSCCCRHLAADPEPGLDVDHCAGSGGLLAPGSARFRSGRGSDRKRNG